MGPLDAYGLRSMGARRALAETSAYLSELARGPELVKLNLALLASHVIAQRTWGSAEYYAGLVVLEGLARELGMHGSNTSMHRAPERASRALGPMLSMDDQELSRAARCLWEGMMGHPLLALTAP